MNQVSEILGDKGRDVLKIDAESSALEAVRQMVDANVGSLLVTDGDEVTGIVTERDYLRRVAQEGPTDDEVTVREIMSSPLVVVSPETAIDECMAVMTDRRIRHFPSSKAATWSASSRSATSSSSSRSSRASRSGT